MDDPVAKYLPAFVRMPAHGGKEITLLQLATHSAGFPVNPVNMTGKDGREQYETYTVEKIFAFLSSYALSRDPGTEFEYSNVGMALLGHAGGAGSYHAWIGFDNKQRRGVVVLSTANELSVVALGWTLLQRLPLNRESAPYFARELVGLGFAFDLDTQTDTLRITTVFPDSPASKAGLSPGMMIQKIENVPTAGTSITECRRLLRTNGSPKILLELVDPACMETNTVEVIRGRFLISS